MHRHGPLRGISACAPGAQASNGRFGRLFPELPPLRVDPAALRSLAGAMVESADNGSADNPAIPAAYTYLGQFIDHNITFDTTSLTEAAVDPDSLTNYRRPRFDLDSVYGAGPVATPHLYQRDDPDLFEIGAALVFKFEPDSNATVPDFAVQADLPRARNRFALIGDPRNDENLIVAQLHLAFLFFHNSIVKALRADRPNAAVFAEARELAILHYQWLILHEFLPLFAGQAIVDELLAAGTLMRRGGRLFMPVEFSAAAYRFGHSTLRPLYDLGQAPPATLNDLFTFSGRTGSRADVPIPKNWIVEWFRLLHMDESALENTLSRRIDPYLADDLAKLPFPGGVVQSLAELNLLRGNELGLPSGQSVARLLGYEPLSPEEIGDASPDGQVATACGLLEATPLWYYILKEALVRTGGASLGPVGARIVAEVFIGLLQLDRDSILNRSPAWTPTLPAREPGTFTFPDLLRFAGVMPQQGPGPGPALLTPHDYKVSRDSYSPV